MPPFQHSFGCRFRRLGLPETFFHVATIRTTASSSMGMMTMVHTGSPPTGLAATPAKISAIVYSGPYQRSENDAAHRKSGAIHTSLPKRQDQHARRI